MGKLKQFLANKNVVTLLGAIIIVIVLYAFYQWRVNQATSPIKVPYANQAIDPRTEITDEMISYLEIPQSSLKGNVLLNTNTQIIGMYTNVNVLIPEGSFFYKDALTTYEGLADSFLYELEDGLVAYNFDVSTWSTYGNSMYPGNFVDIYFKGVENEQIILGKLVENVKILAVKDSEGNHVFETTAEQRQPKEIIFGVPEEVHSLLRTAEYIKDAEVILVPTNYKLKDVEEEEEQEEDEKINVITDEEIRSYIEGFMKK